MAVVGKLLKNRRSGQDKLAWNASNLAGEESLSLSSSDFGNEETIPVVHVAKRLGGQDLSPALTWSPVPEGTVQLLLVIEDPDAPTPTPFVHCVALLEPSVTSLPQGALDASSPAPGVRVLRSTVGHGYRGPGPIKGHGPHRYVFQIFALSTPVTVPDSVKPREVIADASGILARGRLDGFYERV